MKEEIERNKEIFSKIEEDEKMGRKNIEEEKEGGEGEVCSKEAEEEKTGGKRQGIEICRIQYSRSQEFDRRIRDSLQDLTLLLKKT